MDNANVIELRAAKTLLEKEKTALIAIAPHKYSEFLNEEKRGGQPAIKALETYLHQILFDFRMAQEYHTKISEKQ